MINEGTVRTTNKVVEDLEKSYFESRRKAAGVILITIGVGIAGIFFEVLGDNSGIGLLAAGLILVIVLPLQIFSRVRSINKRVPLVHITEDELSVRPTRHDDTITLSWSEISKVNVVQCAQKNMKNTFLVVHPSDVESVMSKAPRKLKKKMKKYYKHSSSPICLNLHGLCNDLRMKLAKEISVLGGQTVHFFDGHKQLEHYREVVRANNDIPPNELTYKKAAQRAKTPKEVTLGILIGVAVGSLFVFVVLLGAYARPGYFSPKNKKDAQASNLYLQKANEGDLEMQILVAEGYYRGPSFGADRKHSDNGRGFEKNIDKSIKFYKLAVAQGSSDAAYDLFELLYYRKEYNMLTRLQRKSDLESALKYLTLAAELGNEKAQFVLGKSYLNNSFMAIEADANIRTLRAEKWLKEASKQGNADASELLNKYFPQ